MLYKICPVCGYKNSVDEIICKNCLSDISNIVPTEGDEAKLILQNDKTAITINPNDVLGRENKGAEYLSNYKTVSRKHCQFFYENDKWYIQDLNSTNKTYLNSVPIEPLKKIEIKNNDEIAFSSKVKFKVKI
jgi:pSer/pThr/pTyr-binding forkhead associated (FHA) protein